MIVITHATGFLASSFIEKLNEEGYNDLVLVDDFSQQQINTEGRKFVQQVDSTELVGWIGKNHIHIEFVFHFENNASEMSAFTQQLWKACITFGLPFVFGNSLKTANAEPEFANWIEKQDRKPYFWADLNFYNLFSSADQQNNLPHIYIKDAAEILYFFMHNRKKSGSYHIASTSSAHSSYPINDLGLIGYHKPFTVLKGQ